MNFCASAKSLQLCPALCNPMDCSPPGSSVHGILQARILEWVAMPSPSDQTHISSVSCIGRQVLYSPATKRQSNFKMAKGSKQEFLQRYTNGYEHTKKWLEGIS